MHNIRLVIQYEGTDYHGWQKQPFVPTIERAFLDVLEKITGEKVKLYAAARTDSGVHARCQVVSFKTSSSVVPTRLQLGLNGLLPKDIVVEKASYAPDGFNARYSAKSRAYRYSILNRKFRSPFDERYSYFFPYHVDLKRMNEGARFLLGTHDFACFQGYSGRREKNNTVRTVKKVALFSRGGFIHLNIQANGFLTHMVRIVIGTLLEVGRGRIVPEDVEKILLAKDRTMAGPTLPAKGLCLMVVKY